MVQNNTVKQKFSIARLLHKESLALAKDIAYYLATKFDLQRGFQSREFYGTAFAVWLWSYFQDEFASQIENAFKLLSQVDKPAKGSNKYHWEFVRFGLSNALRVLGLHNEKNLKSILGGERFAYTRVANWVLLRSTVRLYSDNFYQHFLAWLERVGALLYYQKKWGFIEDERGKPSLQYHAFSVALLGWQIYEFHVSDHFSKRRFRKALEVLDLLTLPGGQCNYWGRGQGQIFGYAASILAFTFGSYIEKKCYYLERAYEILSFLKRFVHSDGSLPLVLGTDEPALPLNPNPQSPQFLGWYSYNNYFDYLAFTGALLAKVASLVARFERCVYNSIREEATGRSLQIDELKDGVRIFSNAFYSAVVTRPFASLSSALVMPYLSVRGTYPLPYYGGEDGNPLYTTYGLPLPMLITPRGKEYNIYDILRFRWLSKNSIEGRCPDLIFVREFNFADRYVVVKDELYFKRRFQGYFVKLPRFLVRDGNYKQIEENKVSVDNLLVIESDGPLHLEDKTHYSASGKLVAFYGGPIAVKNKTLSLSSTLVIRVIP